MPLVDYGLSPKFIQSFKTPVPSPRANTYVLNLVKYRVTEGGILLKTNYSNMRSQFALHRWIIELDENSFERKIILKSVLPLGGTMIIETADRKILVEERGKVEIPGKYSPAPAGGFETRNWKVFPDFFRSIQGEAWEETGLLPGDYEPLGLIGLVRDQTDVYRPSLLYHTTVKKTLAELISNAESIAPEADEHQRLFGVDAEAGILIDFCVKEVQRIVGNGLGAFLAFGGYKYTQDWVDEAVKKLNHEGIKIEQYYDSFP